MDSLLLYALIVRSFKIPTNAMLLNEILTLENQGSANFPIQWEIREAPCFGIAHSVGEIDFLDDLHEFRVPTRRGAPADLMVIEKADVILDVYSYLLGKISSLTGKDHPQAYVTQAVTHRLYDVLRRLNREIFVWECERRTRTNPASMTVNESRRRHEATRSQIRRYHRSLEEQLESALKSLQVGRWDIHISEIVDSFIDSILNPSVRAAVLTCLRTEGYGLDGEEKPFGGAEGREGHGRVSPLRHALIAGGMSPRTADRAVHAAKISFFDAVRA